MKHLLPLLLLASCSATTGQFTSILSVETEGAALVRSDLDATLAGGDGDTTVQLLSKTAPGMGVELVRIEGGKFWYRNRSVGFEETLELDDTGTLVLPWHAAQLFPGAQANVPFVVSGVTVRIAPPLP